MTSRLCSLFATCVSVTVLARQAPPTIWPIEIDVERETGKVTVRYSERSATEDRPLSSSTIPLFLTSYGERLTQGIAVDLPADYMLDTHVIEHPIAVYWDGMSWNILSGGSHMASYGGVLANLTHHARNSSAIPVHDSLRPVTPIQQGYRARNPQFFITLDNSGLPPAQHAAAQRATLRTFNRIRNLFAYESVPIRANVTFFNRGATAALAVTSVNFADRPYAAVRDRLQNRVDLFPDNSEITLYDFLPLGSTVMATTQTGVNAVFPQIRVFGSLDRKWFPGVEAVFNIEFNTAFVFDFNLINGIPATQYDYEASLTHELLHGHGFFGHPATGTPTVVRTMELFRLSGALGSSVSGAVFQDSPRMMQMGTAANFVMRLADSNRVHALSFGPEPSGPSLRLWSLARE